MNTRLVRTSGAFTTLVTAGVALATITGCAGADRGRPTAEPSTLDSIVPSALSEVPEFEAPSDAIDADLPAPAADPIESVRRYVTGEIRGDVEQSYTALSSSSRQRAGSVADWTETAFQRPTIVDYEIDAAASVSPTGASAVIVPGEVTLEPRLDEVAGFVPQRAEVEWKVVAEAGGWRLDLVNSSLDPILPDEQGATAAAERWAAARQQCRTDGEYQGSLLGSPGLGDRLCGVEGQLVAAAPSPLDDTMASQVVAAFGPGAVTWARTVALSGPTDLSVVTAPYGDHWVVVGVTG